MPYTCTPEIIAHAASHGLPAPHSEAWRNELVHCLSNSGSAGHTGQSGVDFFVNSFPGVTTSFLGQMEPAAKAGDLSFFVQAAQFGLPLDGAFQQPGHPDFPNAKEKYFFPLRVAIEHGQEALACALMLDPRLHAANLYVGQTEIQAALQGNQLRTVASFFASPSLSASCVWVAAKGVIEDGRPSMLNAALSLGPKRFLEAQDTSTNQHTNVLFESIACANAQVFDACIAHGMRPWQLPAKDANPPLTACDWLCSGRDKFLRTNPSPADALTDLIRRKDLAIKLDALGFGPAVTDKVGHNGAHSAAVWRTPELLDFFLTLRPHLFHPGADGGYPLHLVASNQSSKQAPPSPRYSPP